MDSSIASRLSAPFAVGEVKFKPQSVKGNRAMALAYIDSRAIQDRLDEAVGVENWQDDYELLGDGSVVCRLQVQIDGRWITKTDVGSPSEQPDCHDRLKAAFSDALKRAAVKYGIGRYLYRLPILWADFDPVKKQFVALPQLPAHALPSPAKKPASLPNSGSELQRRLRDYDAKLAAQKLCGVGALLTHVAQAGIQAGYGEDITKWSGPAIPFAVDLVKRFETSLAG
jgi:hypothetical protein